MQVYSSLYKFEDFVLRTHKSSTIDVFLKDSGIEVLLFNEWKEYQVSSLLANDASLFRCLRFLKDNYFVHLF